MYRNRQQFAVLHASDDGGASGAQHEPAGAQGGEGGADPEGNEPDGAQGGKAEPPDDGRTVNRYKHEREVEKLNGEIASLKAELEKAKGEQGDAAKVKADLEALKSELADEKLNAKLSAAGCINAKAAKAILGDYEGDVAKLKDACPYLFAQAPGSNVGSTGGEPAPGGKASSIEEKISSVFRAKR